MIGFTKDDGVRAAAGYKGDARDCVVRAIAIADNRPYQEVYDALFAASRTCKAARGRTSPREGVIKSVIRRYLESAGWKWMPTMAIGQGCRVHLRADELPTGRVIVSVSRHLVAVIDGVIHDTHDCSRGGMRCVYGFYTKETP